MPLNKHQILDRGNIFEKDTRAIGASIHFKWMCRW